MSKRVYFSPEQAWGDEGRMCNNMDCDQEADFEIYGDFGHPEDVTDACESHVGDLLGTPNWAVKMYGRESQSWTVVTI